MKSPLGGRNRTGISRAPDLAREMVEATEEFPPSSPGDATAVAGLRVAYARDAEPVGTMPSPEGVGQAAKRALQAVTGARPVAFLDKLGERRAFEAAGTRLYDALASKIDAGRTFRGGPSRTDVMHIRDEEHEHYAIVADAIRALGGDPTVITPSADVQATASKGIPAVVADPRTDLLQSLEAVLVAELADNECWPALVEMAEAGGHAELADRFRAAVRTEREHLARVRTWVATGNGRAPEKAMAAGRETERRGARTAARTSTRTSRERARGRGTPRKTGRGAKPAVKRAAKRRRRSGGSR